MKLIYQDLIRSIEDKGYKKINSKEWVIYTDESTGQEYILVIDQTESIKETVKEVEEKILKDQEEAELSIRQFGILFSENEIVFMRLHPDILDLKVQKLKKDLTKISPAFLKKYKTLLKDIGNFTSWDLLFLRDDIIEEFYQLYSLARLYLKDNIKGIPDDIKREEFAENLMLQLLIIWYIQERKFLDNNICYLIDRFNDYSEKGYENYYSLLIDLFNLMMSEPNNGSFNHHKTLGNIVVTGTAPFINGNFETVIINDNVFYQDKQTDMLKRIEPKKVQIVPILNLFESRDWTEGNIDEFVLGAIYEKLISAKERKESGAYYTPENITSYICEVCIGSYLVERLNLLLDLKINKIIDIFESNNAQVFFTLFNELKNIKIVDPAVGSAHFLESAIEFLLRLYKLIGNKLIELGIREGLIIKALDESGKIKSIELLELKQEQKFNLYVKFFIILSKNIYGVDINASALKVARARLFLTLAKHFDVEKNYFIMFPNVHFNLRSGNSLIGYTSLDNKDFPEKQTSLKLFLEPKEMEVITNRLELVYRLKEYLDQICNTLKIKLDISKEINILNTILSQEEISLKDFKRILKVKEILIRILIVSLNSKYAVLLNDFLNQLTFYFTKKLNEKFASNRPFSKEDLKIAKTFHWIFEFPEVFIKRSGFDIVIGNPPYFRITNAPIEEQNLISELEPFKGFHHGQGDIFYDFIVRSYDLLRENGFFMFIVGRYWLEATYAIYLKKFLKEKVNLLKILDFRELKIFRGVDINNTIILYKKEFPNEDNKEFDVFIYEKEQKVLVWKVNPIDLMSYCGKYNIDNWSIKENWAFLPLEYKSIFLKVKNLPTRIGDVCICSQNNYLRERYRNLFTFVSYPKNVPEAFIRKYRKMNEVKNFTINQDVESYIIIIHDLNSAIQNEGFIQFLEENNLEQNELEIVPKNSNKNIDKFEEIIYVGYRVRRLDFSFIYNNSKAFVDNTYFFAKKSRIPVNFIHSFMYLLGVLNSKLMKFYIDAMGKKKDNDLELGSEVLKDIPIRLNRNNISKKDLSLIYQIDEITSEIVELESHNENISEKKDQLDNLVFSLFNINDEEIEKIDDYITVISKLLFG